MDYDKLFFHLKYPKLSIWVLFIIVATVLFWNQGLVFFIEQLGVWKYFFSFISGALFSLGLFSPFAAGFFVTSSPDNILVAGVCAGLGAVIVDLLIFRFIKSHLHLKLKKVENHRYMKRMDKALNHKIGALVIPYISFALAGILIAAPLPNNIGTVLVSAVAKIRERELAVMSFVLYTIIALFFLSLKYLVAFACGIVSCPW